MLFKLKLQMFHLWPREQEIVTLGSGWKRNTSWGVVRHMSLCNWSLKPVDVAVSPSAWRGCSRSHVLPKHRQTGPCSGFLLDRSFLLVSPEAQEIRRSLQLLIILFHPMRKPRLACNHTHTVYYLIHGNTQFSFESPLSSSPHSNSIFLFHLTVCV